MKIDGAYTLPVARDRAWVLLQDPIVLARCMPGTESLDPAGPDEYRMKMKMTLASMAGLFEGKVRIADAHPPESFRLLVEGSGKIGFMKGEGVLTLTESTVAPAILSLASGTESNPTTAVRFEGEVQVGGTIAAVGQRLLDTTSRMLIKRFFESLTKEAQLVRAAG